LAGGLGYGTYLLSSSDDGHQESDVLRSAGFTGWQLGWLLAIEHLAVAVVGLGVGTWTGLQMSSLMASSVAVTANGQPIVPPVVTITDWQTLTPFYIALVAVVTGALWMLRRPGAERRNQRTDG
ncbi:MAG: ABC transporter permease, partial [SAR202 cluster bacterium]|nr:ABC transporter permease [SAR202 cluster bacterium]